MKNQIKTIVCALALAATIPALAQSASGENFAVKLHAGIGLGDAVSISSSIPQLDKKSSSNTYGVDFGWTFWKKQNHSLEANVGAGYSQSTVTLGLNQYDYSYAASAAADMDGDSYIRYYEVAALEQKHQINRVVVPLYLGYAYRCSRWVRLHADLGITFGFKMSSKLSGMTGNGLSYGIYTKYDNLKIEEDYLNDFGSKTYSAEMVKESEPNGTSFGILAGIGAEFRIYGPLAADISFRYDGGLTNLYKPTFKQIAAPDESNVPIAYSVKDGQQVKSLTDYLKTSKLASMNLNISLIYRF